MRAQERLLSDSEEQKDLLPDSLIHSFINRYLFNIWNIWYSTTGSDSDEIHLMNERIKKEFIQFPDNDP